MILKAIAAVLPLLKTALLWWLLSLATRAVHWDVQCAQQDQTGNASAVAHPTLRILVASVAAMLGLVALAAPLVT